MKVACLKKKFGFLSFFVAQYFLLLSNSNVFVMMLFFLDSQSNIVQKNARLNY